MRARIVFTEQKGGPIGDGIYCLMTDEGTVIDDHWCSDRHWANIDLLSHSSFSEHVETYGITEIESGGKIIWPRK